MLILNIAINVLVAANMVMIGQIGSAAFFVHGGGGAIHRIHGS